MAENDNNYDAAAPQDAREKSALLASITDLTDDAIVSNRLDGTILSWNRGAERMYGYTAEEIIGRNISLFFPEELREEEVRLVARLAASLVVDHFETVRLRKDGTKFDASITSSPMRDAKGDVVGAFRVIRDISARKQAEREASNNLPRPKAMVDSRLDGLVTIDEKGVIQTMNSSAESMFGLSREEAIGLSIDMLAPDVFPTGSDGYATRDLKAGEQEIIGIGREVTGRRKDGTAFPMELTFSAFRVESDSGFVAIVRDITARKWVEDNSALLLASIVASSDDAIISKDLAGRITSWNGGAERIFGFTARQAIGQPIQIIIPPDKMEEEDDIRARVDRGEALQHLETVRKTASGKRIEVEISASPVRNAAGNLIGSSKTIRNLMERNRADADRIQTANKLRAVLDHAMDGLITIDARGTVESFNPACERIFGYTSEEAIGQNVKMLMPEPYRGEHDGYLSRYASTGEPRIIGTSGREVSGRRKDGSVFPMDLSVAGFELGDGKHYSGIVRDISERKAVEAERNQAEAEQKRTAQKLRAVLDYAVDGLITIDAQGTVESFNPACVRIFGYTSEEAIGQNVNILMPEPFSGEHNRHLARYASTGETRIIGTTGREVSGKRKDGSVFAMDLAVAVFELEDGKHFSGIVRDISERKAVEAERERIVGELAVYTRALERSNLELDAFAFAASHDLKAPLRVIHNASKWIEEDLGENLTAEVRENMTLLRSRVQRMDKLLDDLLAYSRIGRETDEHEVKKISGAALMENIHGLIAPPEGFVVDTCITLAGIEVLQMPLQQILINLISNAIKHHDKQEGRIEVSVEDMGTKFRFSVKDDGPGIPAEYHEKIFKMFQTLKPRDQVEGSGMGLALVRKHVEMAGGEVKLQSKVGLGSTFTFTWPKDNGSKQKAKNKFKRIGEIS